VQVRSTDQKQSDQCRTQPSRKEYPSSFFGWSRLWKRQEGAGRCRAGTLLGTTRHRFSGLESTKETCPHPQATAKGSASSFCLMPSPSMDVKESGVHPGGRYGPFQPQTPGSPRQQHNTRRRPQHVKGMPGCRQQRTRRRKATKGISLPSVLSLCICPSIVVSATRTPNIHDSQRAPNTQSPRRPGSRPPH
jgi:hypothetical protein